MDFHQTYCNYALWDRAERDSVQGQSGIKCVLNGTSMAVAYSTRCLVSSLEFLVCTSVILIIDLCTLFHGWCRGHAVVTHNILLSRCDHLICHVPFPVGGPLQRSLYL